jgi:hypothetical protein
MDQDVAISWEVGPKVSPSKIKSFEFCLGTEPSTCDAIEWKNVGLDKTYTFSAINLTPNTKYFVNLRYIDNDTNSASNSESGQGFKTNLGVGNSIVGVYQGCAPSIHGAGYFDYYRISIDHSSNYTAYYELFANATCTGTAINKISFEATINSVEIVSITNGIKTFDMDLKTKSTAVLMAHPGYYPYLNNIAECGFIDWTSTGWKNITGQTCPFLLQADAFHTTYRSVGQHQYITVIYQSAPGGQKLLDVPVPFRKSGDSPAQRENSQFTRTSDQGIYLN